MSAIVSTFPSRSLDDLLPPFTMRRSWDEPRTPVGSRREDGDGGRPCHDRPHRAQAPIDGGGDRLADRRRNGRAVGAPHPADGPDRYRPWHLHLGGGTPARGRAPVRGRLGQQGSPLLLRARLRPQREPVRQPAAGGGLDGSRVRLGLRDRTANGAGRRRCHARGVCDDPRHPDRLVLSRRLHASPGHGALARHAGRGSASRACWSGRSPS